jgi:hypothetical protein
LTYSSTGLSIKVHLWVLQISEAAGKENGQQKILKPEDSGEPLLDCETLGNLLWISFRYWSLCLPTPTAPDVTRITSYP